MAASFVRLVNKQNNVRFSVSLVSRCGFCLSAVTRKQEKFSMGQKKKQNSCKKQGGKVFHKSPTTVFQLDPLTGEHAPPSTDSIRQGTVARVIQQAVDEVLMCPDVESRLRKHQVEVTEVQMTRDLSHATIIWRANRYEEEEGDTVQRLLNKHKNDIRNLLLVYHRLHVNPQLVFIKDRTEQYASAVNRLLDEADCGLKDYNKPHAGGEEGEEEALIDKQLQLHKG